ncbi:MAG: LysR substrate-binding domain-containing protein [Sneathiella sp.]
MDKQKIIGKLIQSSQLLQAIGEEKSFTRAAERLKVHQSAVSHRAKSLEDALGFTLFKRTTRQLELTEAGTILLSAAKDTISSWEIALDKLEQNQSSNLIRLSLPSSLAMKWLIPALPNAQSMDLSVSIDVKEEQVNFQANEADAAIRFGPGPYPGLHSTHLAHCHLQPVASPAYLLTKTNNSMALNDPSSVFLSDRRGETDNTDFNWKHYFSSTGMTIDNFKADYFFDRADLMLQAAMGGMGIGLGRTLLVENDLQTGFLKAIGEPVKMRPAYWLVCSANFAQTDKFHRLLAWLKDEVKKTTHKSSSQ